MTLEPCTLSGETIRLEPLSPVHLDALTKAVADPSVGRWMTGPLQSGADVQRFLDDAFRARDAGTALPFAIVLQATGRPIGSTRYLNVELAHPRVEIGATFVAPEWQRTSVNTEAKYLLLRHAFETLACHRVEFKTDALNEASRRAILRLGATEEGTLRSHMSVTGGRLRDTVYFSIILPEWPFVKANLEAKLAAHCK